MSNSLERIDLGGNLNLARLVCGLWQVADLEKDGAQIDPDRAADALEAYAKSGFDTFDMADHYGSAELIAGRLLSRYGGGERRPIALTKWCPEPGPMTADVVRKGVGERLDRLGVEKVDLLQLHWWTFDHPAWLDALHEMNSLRREGMIGAIGVTNFDAAHLALALADGIPVASNQISFSLIDRRACGPQRLAELALQVSFHTLRFDRFVLDHGPHSVRRTDCWHLPPANLNEEFLSPFSGARLLNLLQNRFVYTQSLALGLSRRTGHRLAKRECLVLLKSQALSNRRRP